jgi:hypothetical protein
VFSINSKRGLGAFLLQEKHSNKRKLAGSFRNFIIQKKIIRAGTDLKDLCNKGNKSMYKTLLRTSLLSHLKAILILDSKSLILF